MSHNQSYTLEMKNISKRFGNVFANNQVSITIKEGTVHSIVGENGAGKTTLMNILYGLYQEDSGEVFFGGKKVNIKNPSDAIQLGIGMIHQHFKLIPAMTVAENVMLGMEPRKFKIFLDKKEIINRSKSLSMEYGLAINPSAMVEDISVGIRQRVEILKALYRDVKLLILDEPTALLTPQESADLFKIINQLKSDGITIVFISHKLKEIMEISDRITVLRDGKYVDTFKKSETNEVQLAQAMVGRDVLLEPAEPPKAIGEPVLSIRNLTAKNADGQKVLDNISLDVRSGEILGIAGIDGNGQTELVQALIGIQSITDGSIRLKGKEIAHLPVRKMRGSGIGVIPEDRIEEGLVEDFDVKENSFLGLHRNQPYSKRGFIDWKYVRHTAQKLVKIFDIRTPTVNQPARLLSGGNQQKVIVAREIFHAPDTIIAAQPTRGLDIAATEFVHAQLIAERDRGKAILLLSLTLDEIMLISTRIAVIYKGAIVSIIEQEKANLEDIGLIMLGGSYEKLEI